MADGIIARYIKSKLAVHHHPIRQIRKDDAREVMVDLFDRCKSQFDFHGSYLEEAMEIGNSLGFTPIKWFPQPELNRVCHLVLDGSAR